MRAMVATTPKPRDPEPADQSADPWEDRDGKRRPTPQRRERGAFRLVPAEDAGVTYAYDDCSTPLRSAFTRSQISRRQIDAGEAFERLVRAVSGSPGPRSCLDFTPRGGDQSDPEWRAHARNEFVDLCRVMGQATSSVMLAVCHAHQGTGPRSLRRRRWQRLLEGLTAAADFWKLPPDEAGN